ncbi:MAG: diguanylate cyclase [gamma proteobacterium symbiont of Taylorina sp.]|nr:diguanylate cyclase [gamma proteobacterium symbiont of Taylorina sp.]
MKNNHKIKKLAYTKTIGYKLTISYLIAALFVFSVGLFFSLRMVQNNYSLMVDAQFRNILSAHEYALEQYFPGPETWAEHLANEHDIQTILSNTELSPEDINAFVNEHNVIFFKNTYINILNAKGRIIYCSNNCNNLGRSLSGMELIQQVAKSLKTDSAIANAGDKFAFYSVAPVIDNTSEKKLLGFIAVAKNIDDKYISGSKVSDDVEIAIVRDRAIMASTIKINGTPLIDIPLPYLEYLSLLNQSNRIIEIEFQQQKYFILAKKIKRMSHDVSGSIMLLKPRRELEAIEADLITQFMYLILLSLVIIIITSTGIARQLLTPVSHLTETTIEIINGRRGIKAKVESKDEIGQLASNFNTMLGTIEKQHNLIEKQNESLEEKVRQRTNDLMKLTVAVEKSPVGMVITDAKGVIEYVNPRFSELSGYSKEEAIGNTPGLLKSGQTPDEEYKQLWQQISSGHSWRGELYNRAKDGRLYWERLLITPIKNDTGQLTHFLGSMEDITRIKEYKRKLVEQATYDTLTNLPNRFLAEDRLNNTLSSIERHATKGALLFIDLDDFKKVNDTLGHHTGDELLKRISFHMSEAIREEDTVARLGGDEFLIILKNINNPLDAENIARKVIALASQEFIIENNSVLVSSSIGIALFPEDDMDAKNLMQKADSAMYMAKKQGKNTFHFFSPELNKK